MIDALTKDKRKIEAEFMK